MDFSQKPMWQELILNIYLGLLEDIDKSIFKNDEFYNDLAVSISIEAILSIEFELSRQKAPFYIEGVRSAAFHTYACRRNNEINKLIRLKISGEHERLMLIGNFKPAQRPEGNGDTNNQIGRAHV